MQRFQLDAVHAGPQAAGHHDACCSGAVRTFSMWTECSLLRSSLGSGFRVRVGTMHSKIEPLQCNWQCRTRTPRRGLPVRLGPLETPSQPRSGLVESRRVASRDSDQNARLGASAPRASSGPCVPSRLRGGGAPPHPPLACHLQVPEIQIGQTLCVAPSK